MGGSINIAARFNNGETICVSGWTNFIPNMILNETTLSGDDSIVRRDLMASAIHENYDGPQPFHSSGYGMVAIDFISKQIHSKQGYTSFDRKYINSLVDLNKSGYVDGEFHHHLKAESQSLIENGRVFIASNNGIECDPIQLTSEMALDFLAKDLKAMMTDDDRMFIELRINLKPFTVIEYPEERGLCDMKSALCDVDFPLTKKNGLNRLFE